MSDTFQVMTWTLDGNPPRSGEFGRYLGPKDAYDEPVIDAVQELGLKEAFDEAFLPTKPGWFGLWVTSPLTNRQIELLMIWLRHMKSRMPIRCSDVFDDFITALDEAQQSGRTLHVSVNAPGHIDFGSYTAYVHCPRCKAEGPFDRWQASYPSEEAACAVCGFMYSPAATYASSQNRPDVEAIHCKSCTNDVPFDEFSDVEIERLDATGDLHGMKLKYEIWRDMSDEDLETFYELNGREITRETKLRQIQDEMARLNDEAHIGVSCPRCHRPMLLG